MTLSRAILATLAYHDIFNFPLKLSELANYLISVKADQAQINAHIKRLLTDSKIGERHDFYYLADRSKIIKNRKLRQRYAASKFKKARFYAQILKLIPQIKLVAISGALAMGNSTRLDDIDLVIITEKSSLWTARFFANVLLFPFKRKAQPPLTIHHSPLTNNKACLNIFLDESHLKIYPQNIYTAHEICQMKLLWERHGMYRRFINANRWVYKFLPNWQLESSQLSVDSSQKDKPSTVENFLRNFQLWYMRSRITTERIGEHQLFFHPNDTQEWILGEYQKRLKR